MTLLDTLAREHRLFERLLDRLERAVASPEDDAWEDSLELLLVLLPALERHEEIEREALGEHEDLAPLRRAFRLALACPLGWRRPRAASELGPLVARLRRHFREEEETLWPRAAERGRSLSRSAQRGAAARVRELEREMVRRWSEIEDYLGARR